MKPMGEYNLDSDWRWDGTLWDFVDIVQWAMVFHTVAKNHEPDAWKIVSDRKLVRDYEDAHGITRRSVVSEMLRIGKDGANMFWAIDEERQRQEQAEEESLKRSGEGDEHRD